MDLYSKDEWMSRRAYVAIMCLGAYSCGAYTTAHRTAHSAPPPSHVAMEAREDGGVSVPAYLVLPVSPAGHRVCDGPACPFPGPEPGEEQHLCVTYLSDEGRRVTLDTGTLAASSCNADGTVLVHEYGRAAPQYLVEIEGEHLDRLDHEIRLGELGRVAACTMEPGDADGGVEGDRYAVSHVRVLPPTGFHFDANKNGAFVADEN